MSVIWIISNDINPEKKCKFSNQIEYVSIKKFDKDLIKSDTKCGEALKIVEHYGLSDAKECERYFKRLIR